MLLFTDVKDDPLAIMEFRSLFLFALEDGLSVGAFVSNPDKEKPILAGLNVLFHGGKEKHLKLQKLIVSTIKVPFLQVNILIYILIIFSEQF